MTVMASARNESSVRQLIHLLLPLGSVTVLVGVVGALTSPFLSLFLSGTLHADPVHSAVFLFATPLSGVLAATVIGRLSDRPAMRRRLLLFAAGSGCVGYGLFAIFRDYWVLLGLSVTLVAISGSMFPQVFAFGRQLIDQDGSSRGPAAISSLRMLVSLSWVAGPPVAAILLGVIDFSGVFAVTAAGYALAAVIVIAWLAEPAATVVPAAAAVPATVVPAPASGGGTSALFAALGFTLMQSAAGLGMLALPLFLSVDLHSGVRQAGVIVGTCAALEIPLMVLFGALAARVRLRLLVLLGGGFGVGYYVVVSFTVSSWQVGAAQLLNACFISAVTGLGISYFQDLLPGYPGRATTMFTNTNRISAMVAGPIFGVVQHFGYRLAYGFGAGLCSTGLLVLVVSQCVVDRSGRRSVRVTRSRAAELPVDIDGGSTATPF
jgi:MFS transporter, SET family, sugar efflux transporter